LIGADYLSRAKAWKPGITPASRQRLATPNLNAIKFLPRDAAQKGINSMIANPTQLKIMLTSFLKAGLPILITGATGVGKSDIVDESRSDAGFDLIVSHPAVSDPTDFKGLPWPDATKKSASFIPFGEFNRALNATTPTAWFFDDLGQAPNAVQAACMQLFLARRVNGHILPDCVTFVGATNRRTDRAGVSGILEPVKSRFVSIVELATDIDSWCRWAFAHNVPPMLIAFLRYRSELLSAFNPTADLTNSPLPRTWAHLAKIEALQLPADIEAIAMAGAVGEGASIEYLAFRAMANNLINLDAMLHDPKGCKLPTKPDQLYATAVGLAGRANAQTFSRIGTIAERLISAAKGEFAVLMVRDSLRRDDTLQNSATFLQLLSGKYGELISGKVN
jgi:hypothetical protein